MYFAQEDCGRLERSMIVRKSKFEVLDAVVRQDVVAIDRHGTHSGQG
jgi:hypothetical protein